MDAPFWIKSWKEGRTHFHQQHYHEKLTKYFPGFNPEKGQKVLVPLCGKTKDLLWLHELGLDVHGIELYEPAVKEFFKENNLPAPEVVQSADFRTYACRNILIRCGDFFRFREDAHYDFVYDRAALVALPAPLRRDYARIIKQALKPGGQYLLVTYAYDQSKMDGPPFSVDAAEIHELYADQFTIQLMESQKPGSEGARLSALEGLKQQVYVLEKL